MVKIGLADEVVSKLCMYISYNKLREPFRNKDFIDLFQSLSPYNLINHSTRIRFAKTKATHNIERSASEY